MGLEAGAGEADEEEDFENCEDSGEGQGVAVQNALAASLLAAPCPGLVLDQSGAPVPELDHLLHGQRWSFGEPAPSFN